MPILRHVLACLATAAVVVHVGAEPVDTRLDDAVDREHAAGRFDGVVLVGRGDAVAYQRAVGAADRAAFRAHAVDDAWRLASFSKQVAAVIAMQQVEAGRITLESRLDALLPGFASPLAGRITLRDLLQHTSGLPNPDDTLPAGSPPDAVPPFHLARFEDEAGPVRAALAFCAGPTDGVPGARFSYDNCDTLVLQAVLERLTGRPYARLVQEDVAAPLGLASWSLVTPGHPRPTPVGYLDATRAEPPIELATFGAAGALVGSAPDLWRFDRALMRHRLLGEAATRTLWAGDPKLGYVALGAWSFAARLPGCDGPVALVERRGEIGGVQVRNLIAPDRDAALIVLSNTSLTGFGEIWQGRGWLHELAGAAFCPPARVPQAVDGPMPRR